MKLYFLVFLLHALFGKLVEIAGFSDAIVLSVFRVREFHHAIPVVVVASGFAAVGGALVAIPDLLINKATTLIALSAAVGMPGGGPR